jgi:phage tail tube protein FII
MRKQNGLFLIIVLLLVLILGTSYAYGKYYFPSAKSYSAYLEIFQEYENEEINSIYIDSINHSVVIKPSNNEKIKVSYYQKVDNSNTFKLEQKVLNMEFIEKVENFDSLLFQPDRNVAVVTIYLPQDCIIDVNVKTIIGSFSISDVDARNINFNNITGDFIMSNVNCNSIIVSCNTGDIKMSGTTFNRFNGSVVSGDFEFLLMESVETFKFEVATTYGQLKLNNGYIYETNLVNEIETVEKSNSLISDSSKEGKVFIFNTLRGNILINTIEEKENTEESTEVKEVN